MRSVITGSGAELAQPLQLASKRNRDESRCIKTLHQALLVSPPLKQFLAAFSSTTGIVLRFLHVGSGQRELLQALRRHAFCAALVNTEQERLRCIERLRDLLARVTGSGIPEKSASICGFSYFGVTLRARGSTVGTLLAGPVFYRTPAPKDWMRVLHRLSTADAEPVCVTFAKKFILEKCEERLTVAQVARCVSLHPDYFGKIFRNATGMTLTEYTARVRVEKVKDRLPERSFRIGEVAFAAGFHSLAQFNRDFKKYAGLSPSQYRVSLLAGQH